MVYIYLCFMLFKLPFCRLVLTMILGGRPVFFNLRSVLLGLACPDLQRHQLGVRIRVCRGSFVLLCLARSGGHRQLTGDHRRSLGARDSHKQSGTLRSLAWWSCAGYPHPTTTCTGTVRALQVSSLHHPLCSGWNAASLCPLPFCSWSSRSEPSKI